ncbi:MAG TPA: signal peptidase II [Thermodesulfobacteriota bacterium]|nr:signal peptidase II [Thermodesulfobacteriota bacterium]
MNKYGLTVFIALFVVIFDQITKIIIRSSLALFEKIPVLPFLNVVHVRNPGAAFGILNDLPENVRMPLFALVLIVAIVAIFTFLKKTGDKNMLQVFSLSLILGGAIGNSIDRFRFGYVTDFIDLHWFGDPKYHWPAFNIADSAITIGVILILFETLFLKRDN